MKTLSDSELKQCDWCSWKDGILSTLCFSQNEITIAQQILCREGRKNNFCEKDSKECNEELKIK